MIITSYFFYPIANSFVIADFKKQSGVVGKETSGFNFVQEEYYWWLIFSESSIYVFAVGVALIIVSGFVYFKDKRKPKTSNPKP